MIFFGLPKFRYYQRHSSKWSDKIKRFCLSFINSFPKSVGPLPEWFAIISWSSFNVGRRILSLVRQNVRGPQKRRQSSST